MKKMWMMLLVMLFSVTMCFPASAKTNYVNHESVIGAQTIWEYNNFYDYANWEGIVVNVQSLNGQSPVLIYEHYCWMLIDTEAEPIYQTVMDDYREVELSQGALDINKKTPSVGDKLQIVSGDISLTWEVVNANSGRNKGMSWFDGGHSAYMSNSTFADCKVSGIIFGKTLGTPLIEDFSYLYCDNYKEHSVSKYGWNY